MEKNDSKAPVCMEEEYWANTQLSIARYYGCIKFSGFEYYIVNKEGKDIFELSVEAEKAGREKAIEPGEPADLCRKDFIPFYRKLKREAFINVLKENRYSSDTELKRIFKELTKK